MIGSYERHVFKRLQYDKERALAELEAMDRRRTHRKESSAAYKTRRSSGSERGSAIAAV